VPCRTTRISAASSWLSLEAVLPPMRTSNEAFRVPGSTITPVPGTNPKRFISRRAIESRSETLLITDTGNSEALAFGEKTVALPMALPEIFTPIPYIIPAQLFAATLAAHKGLNPDHPRTLSKVTRTL